MCDFKERTIGLATDKLSQIFACGQSDSTGSFLKYNRGDDGKKQSPNQGKPKLVAGYRADHDGARPDKGRGNNGARPQITKEVANAQG